MTADGSEVTRLTEDPAADRAPSWSPDGKWVYFVSSRGVDTDIYRMAADGSQVAPLTLHRARAPTWSPDGNWIAFVSKSGPYPYTYAVFKVRADGTEETRLTESGGCGSPDSVYANDFDLSWSPDGDWIAFVSDCGAYTHDIFKVRADGSEVKRLTHNSTPLMCRVLQDLACGYYSGATDHAPAWSP
jgi:Tol biopolymer transport system component